LLHPDRVVGAAVRAQRRSGPQRGSAQISSPRSMPVDTFVVLMMENRSFVHYLGWLPGTDGRRAGLALTDRSGMSHTTHRLAADTQGCGFLDPDHSCHGGRQLAGGNMDGFLRAASDTFCPDACRDRVQSRVRSQRLSPPTSGGFCDASLVAAKLHRDASGGPPARPHTFASRHRPRPRAEE
jgi:hypothetical protein